MMGREFRCEQVADATKDDNGDTLVVVGLHHQNHLLDLKTDRADVVGTAPIEHRLYHDANGAACVVAGGDAEVGGKTVDNVIDVGIKVVHATLFGHEPVKM